MGSSFASKSLQNGGTISAWFRFRGSIREILVVAPRSAQLDVYNVGCCHGSLRCLQSSKVLLHLLPETHAKGKGTKERNDTLLPPLKHGSKHFAQDPCILRLGTNSSCPEPSAPIRPSQGHQVHHLHPHPTPPAAAAEHA